MYWDKEITDTSTIVSGRGRYQPEMIAVVFHTCATPFSSFPSFSSSSSSLPSLPSLPPHYLSPPLLFMSRLSWKLGMKDPLMALPDIAMMDLLRNTNNPFTCLVSVCRAKWVVKSGKLALVTSRIREVQFVEVGVLRTSVEWEAVWYWDVLNEPGVDTRPVNLGVGGRGVNDGLLLRHCTPQSSEFIRNNFSSFFSSPPSSSFLRLDFIGSDRSPRRGNVCPQITPSFLQITPSCVQITPSWEVCAQITPSFVILFKWCPRGGAHEGVLRRGCA